MNAPDKAAPKADTGKSATLDIAGKQVTISRQRTLQRRRAEPEAAEEGAIDRPPRDRRLNIRSKPGA
jgi:hypothetical protein